jgi:hypothetical protein
MRINKRINDTRADEQKRFEYMVFAQDKFMSNWEGICDTSYIGFTCSLATLEKTYEWVASRGDMVRVKKTRSDYKPTMSGKDHFKIVVSKFEE